MDGDVSERIENIAEQEGLHQNIIVNRALRRFVEWEYHSARSGQMTVSKKLLEDFGMYLTDEQMRILGKSSGGNWLLEVTLDLFGNRQLTSFLSAVAVLGKYSGRFIVDHSYRDSTHTLMVYHDMGRKWSSFYEEFFTAGLKKLIGERARLDVTSTENQVVISATEAGPRQPHKEEADLRHNEPKTARNSPAIRDLP